MTECRPRPVLHAEVIRDTGVPTPGGLALLGECLQLHSPLLEIPWLPLLERTDDRPLYFPQGPRPPARKCIGHLLPNVGTLLHPHHSNSHPPSLCNLSPPSPIEMTESPSLYLLLLL